MSCMCVGMSCMSCHCTAVRVQFCRWSELRSVAEPDARVGFGCLRRSRNARVPCSGLAQRTFLGWQPVKATGEFFVALRVAWAGVRNACIFFAHHGFVVGQATQRSMAANEYILGELGSFVCIKKGHTLHLAAFVFTWTEKDGNMQLLLILVSKFVIQTRDPCWPKQTHHSF